MVAAPCHNPGHMATAVMLKLLTMGLIVALGWGAARLRWLGPGDVARTLSNAAFYLFVPALLFRTAVMWA